MLIPKHTTAKGVLTISVWNIAQDTCSAQDQYSERCFAPFNMVQQLLMCGKPGLGESTLTKIHITQPRSTCLYLELLGGGPVKNTLY